jgi:hypothetical protein
LPTLTDLVGLANMNPTQLREKRVRNLQLGSIMLKALDGVEVQVERTERRRYQNSP